MSQGPRGKLWPVRLEHDRFALRPLRYSDLNAWRSVRTRNRDWLKPWDPTNELSWPARHSTLAFYRLRRDSRIAGHEMRLLPFVIEHRGALVGQVNVGPIQWGSARTADLGYWVDERVAGQGIAPAAVALAVRYAFDGGLHRVHAAIAPENVASIRVVEKLGMRLEATYRNYLDIDGEWRDHLGFALTVDDDLGPLRALLGDG